MKVEGCNRRGSRRDGSPAGMECCIWRKEKKCHHGDKNDDKCDVFTDRVADHLRVNDKGREKDVRVTSVSSDL